MTLIDRAMAAVGLLAAAVWMGGLIALGAFAAPVVFAVTPFPANADAMTLVFCRFDLVAMVCAAVLLAMEAARQAIRSPMDLTGESPWASRSKTIAACLERARMTVSLLATGAAIFEGSFLSRHIAQLHAAGAIMGVGAAGRELARLHGLAEFCGKSEVLLLAAFFVLVALTFEGGRRGEAPNVGAKLRLVRKVL